MKSIWRQKFATNQRHIGHGKKWAQIPPDELLDSF